MYADDVQIYNSGFLIGISACVNNKQLKQWTLHQSHKILVYFRSNSIYRSNRKITSNIQIKISSNVIEFVRCSKNLGVIFNSKLTWSKHIASAVGQIYGMLRNLWAVKCSTPFRIRMLLAKTYLMHCDANCNLRKLKVAYNNIARYIFNRGVSDSISVFSYQICNMCFENLLQKIIYTAQLTCMGQ